MSPATQLALYPTAMDADSLVVHSLVPYKVDEDPQRWYRQSRCGQASGGKLISTLAAVDCPDCIKTLKTHGGE